jgi:hypothetical protein
MTSSTVIIFAEHLVDSDNTIVLTMRLWSARFGACTYNQWQSVHFQLIKKGYEDTDQPEGETLSARQKRIRVMHKDTNIELHGEVFSQKSRRKTHHQDHPAQIFLR